MKHTLTLLLGFVLFVSALTTGTRAQNANITTVLQMSPNPSPYLSDWQSRRETVTLIATLDRPYNEPVKLMAKVTLNGQIVAATKLEKMQLLSLHQGQNLFYAEQLIPLNAVDFNTNIDGVSKRLGRLPAGTYQLCVGFVNSQTSEQLSSDCRTFTIQDIDPPVLTSPANGVQVNLNGNRTETVSNNEKITSAVTMTLVQLASMDEKSLGSLKAFDLVDGNSHNLYYIDPKITERDSSEAMQIPIQMNIGHQHRLDSSVDNDDTEVVFDKIAARFNLVSTSSAGNYPKGGTGYTFQWLPPMPIPTVPVQYRLRVVPLLPGQNQNITTAMSTPLGKDVLLLGKLSGDFTGDGILEILTANLARTHRFAWAVQAQDLGGNPIGKNNGWSEARTFEIGDEVDTPRAMRESFFDVFETAGDNQAPEPCPYTYRKLVRKFYTPCVNGMRKLYEVWSVFTCSLRKGHTGYHHGTASEVYVLVLEGSCTGNEGPGKYPTEPEPPKEKVIKRSDLEKIPTQEKVDKQQGSNTNTTGGTASAPVKNDPNAPCDHCPCPYTYKVRKGYIYVPDGKGQCKQYAVFEIFKCTLQKGHAGPHEGTLQTVYVLSGIGTCPDGKGGDPEPPKGSTVDRKDIDKIPFKEDADKKDVGVAAVGKVPCPHQEKKLLRTVVGPWKRISTTVRHITWRKTTVAWVDVVWQRDIFNVYAVSHCTLEKGHAGAHVMSPAVEVKEKYGSFTEKVTYGPGESQVPPKPHASDALPQE